MTQPLQTKLSTEYEQKQKELADISAQVDSGGECLLVDQMPLAQCSYVTAHIEELKNFKPVLSLSGRSVKNGLLQEMDAKQREKIQAIINQKTAAQDALDKAVRQAERYDGERKKVLKKLSSLEKEMDRLDRALQAFQHAERLAAGDVQNSKIHQLRERLEKIDSEIHYAKNQLDFYREQSAKKGQELQKLFDELVRRILKADYSGSITTSAVDFTPQIQQGSAIAGAAVESLSFLLMDITSMLGRFKRNRVPPWLLGARQPA